VKINTLEELQVVLADIAPLYAARKICTQTSKQTNETKGSTTQWTFATLSKLLREYMTANNRHDLPLPNGIGSITLGEKKTMPGADATLKTFYPAFQQKYCRRAVTDEETDEFINQLRTQREDNRKVALTLSFVPN
jgi:hypothetical protein